MNLPAFTWGAISALTCAAIVVVATAVGAEMPDNPLVADPWRAAGAGFLWGILLYNVRQWLISRRP